MPSVKPGIARRVLPENPFVGLRSYESNESILFFGRRAQTLELMDRLHDNRFVAVVGSSGCGKSSLVRAGLIPNLKAGFLVNDADRWKIAAMKPGETPLYSLAAALTEDSEDRRGAAELLVARIRELGLRAVLEHLRVAVEGANFLLLVDQFEEIFRSIRAGAAAELIDDATDFVSIMLRLAEQEDLPAYVVMSMRTDFLGDCDTFFGLPEALNRSQYLVPRLTRQQRREVIEGPINLYQKEVKPELADSLLNEAGERSDLLPVLQHALMLTWREFSKAGTGEVTLTDYRACGGIEDALDRHAEQAMEGLTKEEMRLTERIFRVLTDTDERGRRIRRPARLSQIVAVTGDSSESVLRIVNHFCEDQRSFLILSETENAGDQRIDISHEALFRQWKRLEDWVQAEARSKEQYLRLAQSARLHKRKEEEWMRDPALQVAERWRAEENPTEAWAARYGGDFRGAIAYLDASLQERERDLARRKRRTRVWVGSAVGFGVALVVATWSGYFWLQRRMAEKTALFGTALAAEDPLVRALVVAEVGDKSFAEAAIGSIQQVAIAAIPVVVLGEREQQNPKPLIGVSFDQSGKNVLTVASNGVFQRWSADGNGDPKTVHFPAHPNLRLSAIAFNRDQKWIAAGFEDGKACVGAIDGTACLSSIELPDTRITTVAFSPDGSRVIAGYENCAVRIWNRDGTPLRYLGNNAARHAAAISSVQFDPLGRWALTASNDGTARIWEVDTGRPLAVFAGPGPGIGSAVFSPDGKWVMCGFKDGFARIWRSDGTGSPTVLSGHSKMVTSVAFSPDMAKAATGSEDSTGRVWDLHLEKTGGNAPTERLAVRGLPMVLSGHTGAVRAVAFSPDGLTIVTAAEDGTGRIWWNESKEPEILGEHRARVQSVAFSPDGKRVVSSSDDRTTRIWNIEGSSDPLPLEGTSYVRSAAFSPDGRKVVAGSEDGIFCIWNVEDNKKDSGKDFRQEKSDVLSVAFSPSGSEIITGTRDNRARVWPVFTTGDMSKPLLDLEGHQDWVFRAAFNRDGTKIVTASADKTARTWTIERSGRTLTLKGAPAILGHPDRVLSAVFSPDGQKVATASADHKARIWDLSGPTPILLKTFSHSEEVWQVAFSSDQKWLLSASTDKTARIWNIESGNQHLTLPHGSGVRAAAYRSPEDSYVATGAEDGSVRLWRTKATDLIEYLSRASTACLEPRERVRFLGESEAKARANHQACESGHGRTAQGRKKSTTN